MKMVPIDDQIGELIEEHRLTFDFLTNTLGIKLCDILNQCLVLGCNQSTPATPPLFHIENRRDRAFGTIDNINRYGIFEMYGFVPCILVHHGHENRQINDFADVYTMECAGVEPVYKLENPSMLRDIPRYEISKVGYQMDLSMTSSSAISIPVISEVYSGSVMRGTMVGTDKDYFVTAIINITDRTRPIVKAFDLKPQS